MAAVTEQPSSVNPGSGPGTTADPSTFVTQRAGKNVIANPLLNFLKEEVENLVDDKKSLQSTLLLQKKKELAQIHRQLERKRIEFRKRMDECYEKQNELKAKQKQIRERVIKFEKFLKDNEAKRQRANLKSVQERKLREGKEQEIEQLRMQVKAEQVKKDKIQKLLQKYRKFDVFLEHVISTLPSDYLDIPEPHIHDILMRYKTLEETRVDSMKLLQEMSDAIEIKQNQLSELQKKNDDTVLVYNSRMGAYQKKLDKMRIETATLEMTITERDNSGKKRHRILGETTMAINNLYNRVGIRNIQENLSLLEKLSGIRERIVDLMFIASKAESGHYNHGNNGIGGVTYSNTHAGAGNTSSLAGHNASGAVSSLANNSVNASINTSMNNSEATIQLQSSSENISNGQNNNNHSGAKKSTPGAPNNNNNNRRIQLGSASARTNTSSASSQKTSPMASNFGSRNMI